jgi:hypothetical protein
VSCNRLASCTGKSSWLYHRKTKLPQSHSLIHSLSESGVDYACRRILATAKDPKHRSATWKLRVAAGIGAAIAQRKPVADLLLSLAAPKT